MTGPAPGVGPFVRRRIAFDAAFFVVHIVATSCQELSFSSGVGVPPQRARSSGGLFGPEPNRS